MTTDEFGGDWMSGAAHATPRERHRQEVSKPSPARMYDYYLGGKDNFAVDREAADKVIAALGEDTTRAIVQHNRGFLVRAVTFLAERGIDQFLDLGAGIPTSPNVHEVARQVVPGARVVYVDNDPVVSAHTRAIRATTPGVVGVEADVRDPVTVLDDPLLTDTIDFDRPVAVLAVAVLHFVDDTAVRRLLHSVAGRCAPGSYLALSAASSDGMPDGLATTSAESYRASSAGAMWVRPRADIAAWFDSYEVVEPGLVDVARWRADGPVARYTMLAGVGRRN